MKCKLEECDVDLFCKGFCKIHYTRNRIHGDPLYTSRREKGSGTIESGFLYFYKKNHQNSYKNGKIPAHVYLMSEYIGRPLLSDEMVIHIDRNKLNNDISNLKLEKRKKICAVKKCVNSIHAKTLCKKHYTRMAKHGDVDKCLKNEAGLGTVNEYGYRLLYTPNHPNANGSKRIFEHRFIMSEYLGRPLRDNENVHHKNGDRLDNRINNLELWAKSQTSGQRVGDLLSWAKEIISKYDKEYNEKLIAINDEKTA